MVLERKNKGGRPPRIPDIHYIETLEAILKPKWADLIEHMLWLAQNAKDHKVQYMAGAYLMDRILGKPPQEFVETVESKQEIVLTSEGSRSQAEIDELINMTPDELSRRIAERAAKANEQ